VAIPEHVRSPLRASTSTTANWFVAPATVRDALTSTPSCVKLSRDNLPNSSSPNGRRSGRSIRAARRRPWRSPSVRRDPREALQTLLGVRRRILGDDGEQVQAVQAEPTTSNGRDRAAGS
jgi:hypothetical protein